MNDNKSIELINSEADKHNKYAVLVTIASLMLLVVYSNGKYDSWDVLVVFFTGSFGYSYYKKKLYFDWFSCFAVMFILIGSIYIGIYTVIELSTLTEKFTILEKIEVYGSPTITIVSFFLSKRLIRKNVGKKR